MQLPTKYLEKMKTILQDEYEDYLACFKQTRYYGLRVNTNKISVEDFLKISPFKLAPIPWTNDGFYYDQNDRPAKHPYYYAGLYYLQEPSAMLPAQVLPIQEGDLVLDACAAPGGKSSKIANKLNNTGLLFSNDISISRAQIILKTLSQQGIYNTLIMAEDLLNLNLENYFDAILLDAPCSGEGMFRKDDSLIKSWLEKDSSFYQPLQKKLILKALSLLKEGGKLVYSTCTFDPAEDEEIIEYALNNFPQLEVLPISKQQGFKPGLTKNTKNCVRLYPHLIKGEGHFVALLSKGQKVINHKQDKIKANPPSLAFFKDLNKDFYNGNFLSRQNKLYFEPNISLNTQGLRILRFGLLLGEIKNNNFRPSQDLAYALKENEYQKIINLNIDDQRVLKYLKCETLDVKEFNVEGIVLVCLNNYPLGFGKVNNGLLKNYFPANLRYQ